jgi:cobalt/nickel transport system permease protein
VHIPDGFLSAGTAAATGVVSLGGLAYGLRVSQQRLDDRQVPLVGVTAAFVFAVQMINFPVGLGTSGHLVGGALAAVLLGPGMAALVLTVVLAVQALVFADGGITALGANVLLMGLIAGAGGAALFRALARALPRTRAGFLAATGITAWLSVVVASVVCTVLITYGGVFGGAEFPRVLATMVGLHALIGAGEAAITVAAVSAVLASRPDLVAHADLLPAPAQAQGAVTA